MSYLGTGSPLYLLDSENKLDFNSDEIDMMGLSYLAPTFGNIYGTGRSSSYKNFIIVSNPFVIADDFLKGLLSQ